MRALHLFARARYRLQYGARVIQQHLARAGQQNPAVGAFEQLRAEVAFQRLDLLAERWLGHAQPFGGAAKMQGFRHGDKVFKLAQFHRAFHPVEMRIKRVD